MAKRYSGSGILATVIAAVSIAVVVGAVAQARNDAGPARMTGAGAWNVQTVGRLPCGQKTALAVRGGYAYLAIGARLVVVDLSDPTTLEPVAWTEPLPYEISDIVVSGNYAYVADQYAGFRVVDISNPSSPFEVGSYDTPGNALRVAVSGNYAYVADEKGGLRVIDISDPRNLVETSFRYVGNATTGVAVVGGYAFAATYGLIAVKGDYAYAAGEIYILDVSNPCAPVEVRRLSLSSSKLHILDVSTPSDPQELCEYPTYGLGGTPDAVDASGQYAYLAINGGTPFNQDGTFAILDLTDPRAPVRRGVLPTWGPLSAVAVAGDYAYVADSEKGLLTIDIRNPDSPTQVGAFLTPQYVSDLAVHGDHLLIPSGEALTIVDTSDKSRPTEISFCDYGSIGGGGPVAVSDNHAFVAISEHLPVGRGREIWVMDVSDPHAPRSVGQWVDLDCCNSDLAVAGTYAYLASYLGGLAIVDISQPERRWIGVVGSCNTPGDAHRIAVSGQYAYVADGPTGLRVIRVSNPSHPMEVGSFATAGYAYSIAVADPYVYVAGEQVVHIVDVSDPTQPVEVGRVSIPGRGEDLVVAFPYLFVADNAFGLHVLDVSDPSHPVEAGSYEIPGGARHLAVRDDMIYLSGSAWWAEMLYVLRFPGEAQPTPTPTRTRTPHPVQKIAKEAENGYVVKPGMDTGISTEASQCGFVETKLGNQGSVTLPFYVQEAGNYAIWARVMAAGEYTGNSFFVSIDGAERFWYEFVPPGPTPRTWFWSRVHTYERPTEERYYFAQGVHTLRFDGREMGARLDRVLVTNDLSYNPDVQDVIPCSSNTPTVTPTASPTATPMPTSTPTRTRTPTPSPTPVPRTRVLLPVIMKNAH